jgi:hypothetical protein
MKRAFFLKSLTCVLLVSGGSNAFAADDAIRRFGTFVSPDGKKQVVVTRRSVSLVDFKVLDSATGKELVKEYVGSDAMHWFLWWENPNRLWGYGSDIGYFKCFDFDAIGGIKETRIQGGIGMKVPKQVWDRLPSTMQKRVDVEEATK